VGEIFWAEASCSAAANEQAGRDCSSYTWSGDIAGGYFTISRKGACHFCGDTRECYSEKRFARALDRHRK
jgi:hypothetical protein